MAVFAKERPLMKWKRILLVFAGLLPIAVFGLPNGKLQLHFIDVGQGDAVLLVSPGGRTGSVLI